MPLPLPNDPDVMLSHDVLLEAVHPQPLGAVTPTVPSPPSAEKDSLVGEIIRGGFEAVKFTLEELLPLTGSSTAEATETVLPTTTPFATEQFRVATIVIVAEAPDASEVNETVRLLPMPPHTPPPVDEHIAKVTCEGRLSVTLIEEAGSGPLFVRVIV
jgi:hypothetical protein